MTHRSTFTDTITVHAGDSHRSIAPGELVDLDEPIGAGTLAAALGAHAASFVPHAQPAAALAPRRSRSEAPAAAPSQE